MDLLLKTFKIKKEDIRTEILAGLTTFFTMSYIIILIPALLSQAGMPSQAVFTAVLLIVGFVNIAMGLSSNLPFALAPFMGDNIFIAYTLVPVLGYNWREISAVIFIVGIILIFMTIFKFRLRFMDTMPESIKIAFTSSLGLCLIMSGLKNSQILDFKDNILSVTFLNFADYHVWLGVIGAGLIILLDKLKVRMSIILGLIILTIFGIVIKDVALPHNIFSLPPSMMPILFKCDFTHIFSQKMISLFFLLFLLINTELHGSIVSVMMKYKCKDFIELKKSLQRSFYVDSSATTVASAIGIPTTGVYADSITGIMAGGKSGLTSVVVGAMFLSALFISPVFSVFPSYAYAAALLYVGVLLISTIKEMQYQDIAEYLSFWLTLAVVFYTLNIGVGMAFAFIIYPLIKLVCGRIKEVPKELLLFTLLSIIFFFIR